MNRLSLSILSAMSAVAAPLICTPAQAQMVTPASASSLAGLRLPPATSDELPLARPIAAGIAPASPTAVDGRLSSRVTGSAGFLCGLQPGVDNTGAATAVGYDPHGRFVGAKLSLMFK